MSGRWAEWNRGHVSVEHLSHAFVEYNVIQRSLRLSDLYTAIFQGSCLLHGLYMRPLEAVFCCYEK